MLTLDHLAVGVLCALLGWAAVAGGASGIWPLAIAELLTLLGVVLWVLSMVQNGRLEWRRTALDLPLVLLVVLVLIQLGLGNRPVARWALAPPSTSSDLPTPLLLLGTVSPERTIRGLLALLTFAGVYLLVVNLIRRRRQLDRLIRALLLVGGLLGFLGLLDYFAGLAWLTWWRQSPSTGRLSGTFVNPDHFASWLGMLVCLALGYLSARARASGSTAGFVQLLQSREGREQAIRRHLPAIAIVVMGLALLFTLSRGGSVSLLVGLAGLLSLLGVLGWARRIFVVMGLVLATTLAYAVWIGLSPLVQRVWYADYGSRWLVFLTSVPMLVAAPVLGVGLGAYPDLYPRYQPAAFNPATVYVNAAANDLLQLVIELGCVGAALSLWTGWRVGRDLLGAHLLGRSACPVGGGPGPDARRSDPFSVGIAAGALGGVLVLLAHSVVDFSARVAANEILAAALLGIATVALHTRFAADGDRLLCEVRQFGPRRRWFHPILVSVVVLAMALGATFVILRPPVVATILREDLGSSLSRVERALAIDPANADLLATRAGLRLDAAQRAWDSGLADGGRVLASWDERRQAVLPLLDGGVQDLRAALSRRPADPNLHQQLARVHWAVAVTDPARRPEQIAAAVTHFRRAIFLAPEDPARYRALAIFAIRQGGPLVEIGLEAARGAIARDRAPLPELVDQLLEAGLSDAQWLAIVPASALDRLQLGAALEAYRLPGPAAHAYRGAVALASSDEASLAHWLLADLLMRQRDYRGAAAEAATALSRDPTNPELLLARARVLAAQGDPAALQAYRAAIVSAEAMPTDALPFPVTAPQTRALVRERVRAGEGVARYYRALAEYLTERRLWAQALPAWEVVLQAAPVDPAAHFGRGVALDGLGTRDKALEAYRRAVSLDGRSPTFRLRLAERLWEAEQFVQAMNEWQSIIAQRPGNVEARLALAGAYVRIGKRTEASQEYQRILLMVPGHDEARRGLARLDGRPSP